MYTHILAVVVTIIICYLWYSQKMTQRYDEFLTGMWLADNDDFCASANIQSMLLYIGPPDRDIRECYIVISDNLSQQGLTLTVLDKSMKESLHLFAKAEFDEVQLWTDKVSLQVDAKKGTLTILDSNDKLCARLFKQHDMIRV